MTAANQFLHQALRAIEDQAQTMKGTNNLSFSFYHWVLNEQPTPASIASVMLELGAEIGGEGRSVHSVGAVGFLLHLNPALVDSNRNILEQGLDWLVGRDFNSPTALANMMQPIAFTGVLVGLIAIDDDGRWQRFVTWFDALFQRLNASFSEEPGWRKELLSLIRTRTEVDLRGGLQLTLNSACAVVYAARGLGSAMRTEGDEFFVQLLGRIGSVVYSEPEQAVLDLAAFRFFAEAASRIDLRATTLDDLSNFLRRIPAGLRRWTWEEQKKTPNSTAQKWAIEHEYHFQNLLYMLLAPVFPDLREEEWLASVGQKKPRADLVIPSLHLVVEVKYWRANIPPQDMISQIAEDVSLYLKQGSPYRHVLPIIWDRGRRTEQYDLLTTGLLEIRNVVSPIVIPQPGFMDAS